MNRRPKKKNCYIAIIAETVDFADNSKKSADDILVIHENYILIMEASAKAAFRKAVRIGLAADRTRVLTPGKPKQRWTFLGVLNLMKVQEEIGDGSELFWDKLRIKRRTIGDRYVKVWTSRLSASVEAD